MGWVGPLMGIHHTTRILQRRQAEQCDAGSSRDALHRVLREDRRGALTE